MMKINPSGKELRRVVRKKKPSLFIPTNQPKSNYVTSIIYRVALGRLETVGYGMNVMKWAEDVSFDNIEDALNKAKSLLKVASGYIGTPNELIVEERVIYTDGAIRINRLHKWECTSIFNNNWIHMSANHSTKV